MKELRQFSPDKPMVLVGTKLDLRENTDALRELKMNQTTPITYQEGLAMAARIGAVKYVECSAFTQQHMRRVFEEAARAVIVNTARQQQKRKSKKKKQCLIS